MVFSVKFLLLLLLLSHFSRVRLCATPETAAHQARLSLGFSRQEHWSGLPFPSPMQESEKWKWSRSVVSDSERLMDCSLPGSSVHGIFLGECKIKAIYMNPKGLITDTGIKKKKRKLFLHLPLYICCWVAQLCPTLLRPHGLYPVRFFCLCDVHVFFPPPRQEPCNRLQFSSPVLRIFPNQRSNLRLCHCKRILYNWATRGAHFYTYSTIKNKIHCIWICKGWNFSLLFLRIHNCSWHVGSFLTFAGWNCSVHSYVYRGVCPAVFCAKKVHWLALSGDLSSPHLIIHNRLAVAKVVYVGVKEREKKEKNTGRVGEDNKMRTVTEIRLTTTASTKILSPPHVSPVIHFVLSLQFSCSSRVRFFATPWTAACQASLSITNSWSSPKLMSTEPVMPSSHLILCRPLLLLPPIPPSIRVFSNESTLRMSLRIYFKIFYYFF